MKTGLKQKAQNNKKEISIVLFTITFLAIGFYLAKPLFETNDDMLMVRILNGQYGWSESWNPIFISPILGRILAGLYHLQPYFPWYSTMLYLVLFCGLLLGFRIIIYQVNNQIKQMAAILAFLGLYIYICVRLNFASCSLIIWFMVFLYAMILSQRGRPLGYRDCLMALLLVASYWLRPDIIRIGILFIAPLIGFWLLSGLGTQRLVVLVVPIIIVMIFVQVNPLYQIMQPDSYKNLQSRRSNIIDTQAGHINENTQTALEKTGWSEADYLLLRHWWTHDESLYSDDKMQEFLADNSPGILSSISFSAGLKNFYNTSTFLVLLFLTAILFFKYNDNLDTSIKHDNIKSWSLLIVVAGLLFGLACIRFPLRVAIPLYIYFLMLIIILRPSLPIKINITKKNIIITEIIIIILFFDFFNIAILKQEADSINAMKEQNIEDIRYIQQHNGADTYFLNFTPGLVNIEGNPVTELEHSVVYNDVPGEWLIGTDQYYNYLTQNGFSSGKQMLESTIDNPRAVFYFYQPPLMKYYSDFTNYIGKSFEDHYGNGKRFNLDILVDSRHIDESGNATGWVYFRIKTAKT